MKGRRLQLSRRRYSFPSGPSHCSFIYRTISRPRSRAGAAVVSSLQPCLLTGWFPTRPFPPVFLLFLVRVSLSSPPPPPPQWLPKGLLISSLSYPLPPSSPGRALQSLCTYPVSLLAKSQGHCVSFFPFFSSPFFVSRTRFKRACCTQVVGCTFRRAFK